jgi:3-dehydroquinate synthase
MPWELALYCKENTAMTEIVHVALGERSYPIYVGNDLLDNCGTFAAKHLPQKKVFILTDANVAPLYLARVTQSFENAGFIAHACVVPAGEHSKSIGTYSKVCEEILAHGCERNTTIVALGGGVIGDLAGFCAASVLRGVPFMQIPTTLLSQVDSSVGGKTGINCAHGKNLIGAFHQPKLVVADMETLNTLPARELKAGYAEVVKYALIDDPAFWVWLQDHGAAVLAGDKKAQSHAVQVSCAAKARVVAEDEKETGKRALLNLGHTFGHAFEAELAYDGRILHGEAVAIGMVLALQFSTQQDLCPAEHTKDVIDHFKSLGIETDARAYAPDGHWNANDLIAHMKKDKKVKDGKMTFILSYGIGQSFLTQDITETDLQLFLCSAVE